MQQASLKKQKLIATDTTPPVSSLGSKFKRLRRGPSFSGHHGKGLLPSVRLPCPPKNTRFACIIHTPESPQSGEDPAPTIANPKTFLRITKLKAYPRAVLFSCPCSGNAPISLSRYPPYRVFSKHVPVMVLPLIMSHCKNLWAS